MATTTETTTTEGATSEGTAAEGGAHHGVFPPLDSKTFPSQLFWLVIFFAALYFLMSRVALPRIAAILDARRNRIEGDLTRAAALKEETEAALNSYQKSLAGARGNATDITRQAKEKVNSDAAAQHASLDASIQAKLGAAEAQIAKSRAKAMESIDSIAGDAAKDIVAALTGGKIDKAALAQAIAAAKQ